MQRLLAIACGLVRRDEGQDLLEYGMLAALIAVVAIAAAGALGQKIHTAFWELIVHNI
jgi:Flp pilus assembly pilin Flp